MNIDQDIITIIRRQLSTTSISDALFNLGLRNHYLPASIRAIRRDDKLVGTAMPVAGKAGPAADFAKMLQALEAVQVGEVYVCATPPGDYAVWGELMSHRARVKGAAGAVLSGFHRDSLACEASGFPLFSAGAYGLSGLDKFHITDFRCAVQFENGVTVAPGDLVVGDADGVLIVPARRVPEVIQAALDKTRRDEMSIQAIVRGQTIA